RRARRAYLACIWLPLALGLAIALGGNPWALLVLLLLLPAVLLSLPILAQAQGMLLVAVLKGTGMYELGYGVLLAVGLVLGSS
ncbi:MAG: 1,4-dihydroxy-2-naphthoate polyprenyltransferase, partial [Promicromonosporaceae bacterium]|nr:1,4-dihydroxy-2-naphthoate polyprenyltransferase [Promicromonosporaceae bacterium]